MRIKRILKIYAHMRKTATAYAHISMKQHNPHGQLYLKLVVVIGGGAPFLAQPWQIDIERPNQSRHAPKRASSILMHKNDPCHKQIVKYLINPWHIFVFSWRVGIRFLTFKQYLVRNREVRSRELGINLNNVSSSTQPRLSHDGGGYWIFVHCLFIPHIFFWPV